MNYSLQVFDYNGSAIRTIEMNNEVWFVAKDICAVLGRANISQAISELDEADIANLKINVGGQSKEVECISEFGFYGLTFRNGRSAATSFAHWVITEVLPQIRRASKSERFTRSIMSAARMIFTAAGLKGTKLALALDKVAHHYTGESMLALSGITIDADNNDA